MPNLTFVLPHWLYWSGLVLFPLLSIYMVRRTELRPAGGGISLALAYMLLVTGGFVGLHRFYLRNWLGALYLPLFGGILYANIQFRAFRNALSQAKHDLTSAQFLTERATKAVAAGTEGAAAFLSSAHQAVAGAEIRIAVLEARLDFWDTTAFALFLTICAFFLVDAMALPRLARRCAARDAEMPPTPVPQDFPDAMAGTAEDPTLGIHTPVTDIIDRISLWSGHFVCYWSMIAVFAYYYEVLARYIFNSPTNWAHEGMFLMFGMQYLLAGAYALREDAHVRVDVLYVRFSDRGKAMVDIAASVFFFIFAGALLWTGFVFARDSVAVWEVSFTEWAIQYWPVKATIALGAFLILMQGISKLVKDVLLLRRVGG
ncbi:MAG: TRAP transporter small permease subunit [Alphaproteobacteria bacterium]